MMSNTPLKINQSCDYIVGMGILWFILRVVAFKSFKARLLQGFITPHSRNMGQIQIRSMP
ncbi:hypothetical protein E5L17_00135 [Helicobacter pylori]|nr:hypothetical protein E5L17_00135 [Helicobacter pylori]